MPFRGLQIDEARAGEGEGPGTARSGRGIGVEDFGAAHALCYRAAVGTKRKALLRVAAFCTTVLMGAVLSASCASTEYVSEGPGQPTDRASGAVPSGAIGVCKVDGAKRPPIVSEKLWEDTKTCTAKTPEGHIRLGWSDKDDAAAEGRIQKIMTATQEAPKEDGGNNQFVAMLRGVRDEAAKLPALSDKVSRDSAALGACDFTYMLNTMGKARQKIESRACTAMVYDPKEHKEVCLFDEAKPEGLWLTNGWACLMNVRAMGTDQSCHRLCAYDDYCARQVSCAGSDIDLLLCAMGVCLPEEKPFGK